MIPVKQIIKDWVHPGSATATAGLSLTHYLFVKETEYIQISPNQHGNI
jgi:hypothetical protein